LSDEEIKALIFYKTDSYQEQNAIDFFTFSYLGNGLNFCDIAGLKYSNVNGNSLNFYRTKTKNKKKYQKEISIFLLPEIKKIIEKYGKSDAKDTDYIFSILNDTMTPQEKYNAIQQFIKTTNKYLQRISKALKFDFDCTTYYARHSWATKMRNSGVSVSFISDGLGHSSIATTETYLSKFPAKDVKENASKLLNFKKKIKTPAI
jgi:integrase